MRKQFTVHETGSTPVLAVLIMAAATPAAALCTPPLEVTSEALVNHRYAWFFIESLTQACLAWQEADRGADSQHAVARLAALKLAVEDFQCAASLVRTFQGAGGPDEFVTKSVRVSATGATRAYMTWADTFQRWVARSEELPLEEAADLKVQNEKAGEFLIRAASVAGLGLLKGQSDPAAPMDRLSLTHAQRTALREGLRRRFPTASTEAVTEGAHTPDLAAKLLDKLLSSPRYKAADEP